MLREQGNSQKTCWSAVASVLSQLSPKKLAIFFLLASAQAIQPSILLKSYRGGFWDKNTCRESSPDCLLKVAPPPFFTFEHICDENLLSDIKGKSFLDQQRDERFIGQTLCHGVVRSTITNEDGSSAQREVDFITGEEGMYDIRFLTSKIFIKSTSVGCVPEPTRITTPEPTTVSASKPTSPKCRVGMWAASSQRGLVTEKNPNGFKYKLIGESDDEVSGYSHVCKVMTISTIAEHPERTSQECRVGMWSVLGKGSVLAGKKHKFNYKFVEDSNDEIISEYQSHICRVIRN